MATSIPGELGPLLGLAVGAVIGIDPLHRIWTTPKAAAALVREVPIGRFEADAV